MREEVARLPGGDRHVTESDAKEGALFYLESDGGFDLKPVKQAGP